MTDNEIMAGMPDPTERDIILDYVDELDDLIKYCSESIYPVKWDRVRGLLIEAKSLIIDGVADD